MPISAETRFRKFTCLLWTHFITKISILQHENFKAQYKKRDNKVQHHGNIQTFPSIPAGKIDRAHCWELISIFIYGISNRAISHKQLLFKALCMKQKKPFFNHIIDTREEPTQQCLANTLFYRLFFPTAENIRDWSFLITEYWLHKFSIKFWTWYLK